MSVFDLGIVVAVYPQGHAVDVLMDNGVRYPNLQVMSGHASENTGAVDLPDIGAPLDDTRWNPNGPVDRYVRAVVSNVRGIPFVIGFILPQVSQMTFNRKNFRVTRHASDVYTTTDDAGNFEMYHPSGTYLRIAATPAHEDLTGQDFDQAWAISQNTQAAVHFHLAVANAGASVASLDIDPAGNVTLQNNGNLTATVGGSAVVNITGTTTVNSTGAATLKAPTVKIDSPATTCTGALTVQGALTFEAGMTGSGGSGAATVSINGEISSTGDQVAGGISQMGHKHGGVQAGGSVSAGPQ